MSFSSVCSCSHAGAVLRLLLQQFREVDDDVLGRDGDGGPGRLLQREAHHRFVDRPDLLHVERAVRQPLAVQHQQVLQHAEDDAVGDARRIDELAHAAVAAERAAFEERIRVRIEQPAVPRAETAGRRARRRRE